MKSTSKTTKPIKFNWLARLIRKIFGVDEQLETLKSIDARLKKLESCVRPGVRHRPHTNHIITGHWNDS